MSKKKTKPKGVVFIQAFNGDGKLVFNESLSIYDFYDELHPIMDDSSEMAKRHIRFIVGEMYDYDGHLDNHWKSEFDANGDYVRCRTVYRSGEVSEH